MTVQVWSPGAPLTEAIAMCLASEADSLRAIVAAQQGTVAGYQVLPNGEAYLGQLQCFLAVQADCKWIPPANHPNVEAAWITRNFQRLASGMTNWDDRIALGAAGALLQNQASLHPQQVRFVQFCQSFVTKVMQRLLWGSPMQMSWPPNSSSRVWWKASADLPLSVATHLADLKADFHGTVPPTLLGLHVFLAQLQQHLTAKLFSANRENAFLGASALSAGLAVIHLRVSRYSLATLHLHRAAELLFTSVCAAAGLIDFTQMGGEGRLKTSIGLEDRLSLMNCHDALEQAQAIPISGTRRLVLDKLNSTRNRLFLTHGLGSTSSADTKAALADVTQILKAFGGPSWESAYDFYCDGFELEAKSLFELSDGLMKTLLPL